MAINFPPSPAVGQHFTFGSDTWQWDGTKWLAVGQSVGTSVPTNPNKLINPFLEIDQANEGAVVGPLSGAGAPYVVDGLKVALTSSSGGNATAQRFSSGGPTGYPYYAALTMTAAGGAVGAGDFTAFSIFLEADELYDTQWGTAAAQPLTVSFWAYCTIAGTYAFAIRNYATTRSYVSTFTIVAASTWQFFTITVPGDTVGAWVTSGNAASMILNWVPACGTTYQASANNTWLSGNFFAQNGIVNNFLQTSNAQLRLGPYKLEVGPQATPMLRRSIQQELARCQRYYEKSYDLGNAVASITNPGANQVAIFGLTGTSQGNVTVSYKSSKRTDPTVTVYSPATGASGHARDYGNGADVTATITGFAGVSGFPWGASPSTGTGNVSLAVHWVADARL